MTHLESIYTEVINHLYHLLCAQIWEGPYLHLHRRSGRLCEPVQRDGHLRQGDHWCVPGPGAVWKPAAPLCSVWCCLQGHEETSQRHLHRHIWSVSFTWNYIYILYLQMYNQPVFFICFMFQVKVGREKQKPVNTSCSTLQPSQIQASERRSRGQWRSDWVATLQWRNSC